MNSTITEDKIISDYIKIPPGENDDLIGQTYRCLCNKNEAKVVQRGWTADWKERIVFLDNDEVWNLQGFFLNWQSVDAVEVPVREDEAASL